MKRLIGEALAFQASDPWDAVTVLGDGVLLLTVRQVGQDFDSPTREALLLSMDPPVEIRGQSCRHFVASSRYEGKEIHGILAGERIIVAVTHIPDDRMANPFDLSWWRGGVALIGTLWCSGPTNQ
jgi:hypothetical protein